MILTTGEIVELQNNSATPESSFRVLKADLGVHETATFATWHTHPETSANLSTADYLMFKSRPDWDHYIIAAQEIRCYHVEDEKVFLYEDRYI